MKLNKKNINTKEHWNRRYFKIQYNIPATKSVMNFFDYGFLPKDEEISVLDIGCGTATHYPEVCKKYPKVKFTGLDISSFACVFNRKKYSDIAKFIELDMDKDVLVGEYDYVISAHTFEHFESPIDAANKCINVCKNKVILVVPYKNNWSYDDEHVNTFDEVEPFTNYSRYWMEPPDNVTIFFEFDGKFLCKK